MLEKKYMSELKDYKKIVFKELEVYFLYLISKDEKSAYDILSIMRERKDTKSMNYKIVHEKVKKLEGLGLIEKVKGKFVRRAIRYRLTAYGLFHCIVISSDIKLTNGRFVYVPAIILEPRIKEESIVLRTILYQYFEEETIIAFIKSYFWSYLLQGYLKETCQAILGWSLDGRDFSYEGDNEMKPVPPYGDAAPIDDLIRDRVKNFIYQIVIYSIHIMGLARDDPLHMSDPFLSEEAKQNAIRTLSKDKKFIKLLREIKDDFNDGCQIFL